MRRRLGESGAVEAPPEPVTPTRRRPALLTALAGTLVWVLLGIGVVTHYGAQLRIDAGISQALYAGDDRAAALNDLLQVLTFPGTTLFRVIVFLPVVLVLVRAGAWLTTAWVLTAVLLVGPITTGLKDLFGRIRPAFDEGGSRFSSLSYPSGHSSGIATLATVALVLAWPYLARRGLRRIAVAVGVGLVLLVGLTRLWLGVHFLSDVLGGWALGLSWSLVTAVAFSALPGGRAALRAPA